jgi:hypothetical protein
MLAKKEKPLSREAREMRESVEMVNNAEPLTDEQVERITVHVFSTDISGYQKANKEIVTSFNALGAKATPNSVSKLMMLCIKYGSVDNVCKLIKTGFRENNNKSKSLEKAMKNSGLTPDKLASKLVDLLNSDKDNTVLNALRMAIPLQLEMDKLSGSAAIEDSRAATQDSGLIDITPKVDKLLSNGADKFNVK